MDAFKILGQQNPPTASTFVVLYECPVREAPTYDSGAIEGTPHALTEDVQTVVTSIIVCNVTGTARTFDISLVDVTATAPGPTNMLFDGAAVAANSTHVLSLGMGLAPGNTIKVASSVDSSVCFTAMGVEIR